MRFVRLLGASALSAVVLSAVTPANAFVPPRWSFARTRGKASLLGKWRVLSAKKKNLQKLPIDVTLEFTATTFNLSAGPSVGIGGKYEIVDQEGDMLTVAIDEPAMKRELDVLIEGPDAMTVYLKNDDGSDEEALRLERLH